jgi:PAS domain S-box-containing protein
MLPLLWSRRISASLHRFDPATGLFTAYMLDSGRATMERKDSPFLVTTGKRIAEDSFLALDRSGVLWVASTKGLLRFDREREQFTTYDQRDGLPDNAVSSILEDRNGNLWVGTVGGLSRFDPRSKTFINYYEADGLAGSAFEGFPAACRSRRGQMFFGNKDGLTSFWPDQIVERPQIPPVVLTGFSLRNLPVVPGPGSMLAKSISSTPSLTLSHEQNMFSFEFSALSYVDPQRNQYRYMLEPLDHSWNRVDAAHRMATFTTLPAGNYTLRVQGSNNRGVWNEQGVALQLHILPPWWATWSFRSICVMVALLIVAGAWQFRSRRLRREFDKLHNVIETIPAYVWSARPDGSIDFTNKRWLEFTGVSLDQALGWGWTEAVHPDDRAGLVEAWREAFRSGKPLEREARVRSADGQYRWLLMRNVPLLDEKGTPTSASFNPRAERVVREGLSSAARTTLNAITNSKFRVFIKDCLRGL